MFTPADNGHIADQVRQHDPNGWLRFVTTGRGCPACHGRLHHPVDPPVPTDLDAATDLGQTSASPTSRTTAPDRIPSRAPAGFAPNLTVHRRVSTAIPPWPTLARPRRRSATAAAGTSPSMPYCRPAIYSLFLRFQTRGQLDTAALTLPSPEFTAPRRRRVAVHLPHDRPQGTPTSRHSANGHTVPCSC